ncbi:endonuclease/exonuclease/phosphatase family protein [Streptomyces sp. NBC_01264]|uniref:endonuclease/exonuclease/phosphatase family protein n=1 Tax=Streptomyces sp. NBC_01264 TaxID=2903804 RepID=UPI002254B6E9|nr:endonuclease/exonuclease/phosphatase family protein [Streptomyces sp. NBC_01264]MCX4783827.1 endonuclease/exonuclease/phosphatase family protein [Streptomyces sp. NBC_01264]
MTQTNSGPTAGPTPDPTPSPTPDPTPDPTADPTPEPAHRVPATPTPRLLSRRPPLCRRPLLPRHVPWPAALRTPVPALPAPPVLPVLPLLLAVLLTRPSLVPNTPGHLGSFLETFLPWLGLAVPLLLALALRRRSAATALALLLPTAAWLGQFGNLLPHTPTAAADTTTASHPTLTAVQHNISDENPTPSRTASALASPHPTLIAVEELTPAAVTAFTTTLAAGYPHHATHGTVGLWSAYPLTDVRPVDIRPSALAGDPHWNRALRATAATPDGPVAVYVVHLPSLRLGTSGFGSARRDESAVLLAAVLAAEPIDRVVLLGDFNGTADDRGLAPVRTALAVKAATPAPGFAFTWPAAFPLARIDQILVRSGTVTRVRTLPATSSDHLPLSADIRFD